MYSVQPRAFFAVRFPGKKPEALQESWVVTEIKRDQELMKWKKMRDEEKGKGMGMKMGGGAS